MSNVYSLYNKNWSCIWDHFDGRLYEQIAVFPDLKEISCIKILFRVYFQLLNLMRQTSCVGNVIWFVFNNEFKEDVFVNICHINNINHEKFHTFMLSLLRLDFNWYTFFGKFVYNVGIVFCLNIWNYLPENVWFRK